MVLLVTRCEEPGRAKQIEIVEQRRPADRRDSGTAYSIPEFCAANDISEGFYRKLRDQGLAPRETRVLRRVLITVEAADEWRREREAASTANQEIAI